MSAPRKLKRCDIETNSAFVFSVLGGFGGIHKSHYDGHGRTGAARRDAKQPEPATTDLDA